jgi:hypothetical protein
MLEKDGKDKWNWSLRNEDVLCRVKDDKNTLQTIKKQEL